MTQQNEQPFPAGEGAQECSDCWHLRTLAAEHGWNYVGDVLFWLRHRLSLIRELSAVPPLQPERAALVERLEIILAAHERIPAYMQSHHVGLPREEVEQALRAAAAALRGL